MTDLADARHAWRTLIRHPTVPLMVAALFALGTGLASGMWAVVDATLLRPLPYPQADRLVAVLESHPERGLMAVAPANFTDWSDRISAFHEVAGLSPSSVSVAAGNDTARRVAASNVTERFFEVMGVSASMGRTLIGDDFERDARVAVVSRALWSQHLAANQEALGSSLLIDGAPHTVVGVMPPDFRMPGNPDIWIPWRLSPEEQRERRFHSVGVIARLRDGISATDAERELGTVYTQLEAAYPEVREWRARAIGLRTLLVGDSDRPLAVLAAAVFLVLVVVAINVASLLLAWLPTRRHEFSVRLAVGATMTRVVRQVVVETLLWASIGLVAGLAVASAFVTLFGALAASTTIPYDFAPRLDARVVIMTALFLLVAVAATAIGPSLLALRRALDRVPRRAVAGRLYASRVAIIVQVALSLVLLATTAALLTGFQRLTSGADEQRSDADTMATEISLPPVRYAEDVSTVQLFARLEAAVAARGDIREAALASYVPPTQPRGNVRFSIEGRATPSEAQTAIASAVSGSAFQMLRIPLVSGRFLDARDTSAAPFAVVISTTLARRYWPHQDPIGQRITFVGADAPMTIVGVVGDVHQPLSRDPRAEALLYLSYQQMPWSSMTLMVAPTTTAGAAVAAVREELHRLDPALAPGPAHSLVELRTAWLVQPRLHTATVAVFGSVTLVLTLVGLYARVAHSATSRAREFAIRQAIGARPHDVTRALLGEAAIVILVGIVTGVGSLPVVGPALRHLMADAATVDLGTMLLMAGLMGAVALGCVYWPSRRAGRMDLAQVMRSE